jgi:hypothetical protein
MTCQRKLGSFLGIDVYRRPDGLLGHRVHRKPTHTNLYLNARSNARSHHHLANKLAVLSTLWFTGPRLALVLTVSNKN